MCVSPVFRRLKDVSSYNGGNNELPPNGGRKLSLVLMNLTFSFFFLFLESLAKRYKPPSPVCISLFLKQPFQALHPP